MPRVLTSCMGQAVATQAVMTNRQIRKFNDTLHFWCRLCREGHVRWPDELWLEDLNLAKETKAP